MRELTVAEIVAVSGGSDVIVRGVRIPVGGTMGVDINALMNGQGYEAVESWLANQPQEFSEVGLRDDADFINEVLINLRVYIEQQFVSRSDITVTSRNGVVTNSWNRGGWHFRATDNRANGVGFETFTRTNQNGSQSFTGFFWYYDN